ncbi:MAG TPA: outer membrane protein assembly factor [Planctomycetota bacterium]|nr:outer membrane protein assembly factor [Planctomycetota bacterium]
MSPSRCPALARLLLALLLLAAALRAQQGEIIKEVQLDGQVGVSHDLLRANLRTRPGSPYDAAVVDEDVRWLADTHGILAAVTVEPGPLVLFRLSRIRRYDLVRLEGNERYDEDELFTAGRLVHDRAATPDEVRAARELIRDKYLQAGFAFVQVDVANRQDDAGRRVAVIRVYEGPHVETEEVRIEGLTALEADDALNVMRSPPGFWSRIFGKDFVRSEVDADVVLLENFVRGEGYLDGRVALGALEWNEDRTEVTVVMLVEEGPRYMVRKLSVEGASAISAADLLADSPIKVGSPWRRPDVYRTLRKWKELYGKKGYLDAETDPVETFDETGPMVDVTWKVKEGEVKTVRDVLVRGNHGTKDEVIRRNVTLAPGQVADSSEIAWSEDVLVSLDYFSDFSGQPRVNVSPQPAVAADQVDVVADVNDETSGMFTFLVGAGSDSGIFGGASIDKRNFDITRPPNEWSSLFSEFFGEGDAFHGAGQRLFFEVLPGTETTSIDIQFNDPWLDSLAVKPWGLTVELYDRTRLFSDYDQGTRGAAVSLDHRVTRQSSFWFGLRREDVHISNIDDPLDHKTIAASEGTTTTQSVEGGFNYKNLDSLVSPKKGFSGALRLESGGRFMGGDVDLLREQATGEWFMPLYEDADGRTTVLHPRLAFGHVAPTGSQDKLPFFENYFVGGSSGPFAVRGFDFQGVGPHESGDAIGGRLAGVFSVEALYPLLTRYNPFRDEEETLLKGVLFFDAGNLAVDSQLSELTTDVRTSAGAGIRLRIPALGGVALSLDYAFITNAQQDDEKRALSFELSRRF